MKKIILTVFLFAGLQAAAFSQVYRGPLQKGFESTAFFGQPKSVIPNYYGNLAKYFLGVVDDPLLNLALNPALLPDRKHYIYAEFSTNTKQTRKPYPVIYNQALTVIPPHKPGKWNIAQPQVTIAYLTRPFSDSGIFVGAAYQGLYFNENYYLIPNNSYRNPPVYSGSIANNILPTDNTDKMNQTGHFFTLWAGYEFDKASIGFKANRSIFNRTGRSKYTYGYYFSPLANFTGANIIAPPFGAARSRNQDYNHWNFTLGSVIEFSKKLSAGISIGLLTSDATQGLNTHSNSLNFTPETTPKFFFSRNSLLAQGWHHSGQTWNGSIHGSYALNSSLNLTFIYRSSWLANDLASEAVERRRSFNKYRYNSQENTVYSTTSQKYFKTRDGKGRMKDSDNVLSLVLSKNLGKETKAYFGVQLGIFGRSYNTTEVINSSSFGFSTHRIKPAGKVDTIRTSHKVIKDLKWKYDGNYRTISFPMMISSSITNWLGIDAGFTPQFTKFHFSNTIIHDYKLHKDVTNGQKNILRNYIDKRKSKDEKHFFYMPAFIGVSLQPADIVTLRISTSPIMFKKDRGVYSRSNWQGFFSVTITP